jgi:hypothetical protein
VEANNPYANRDGSSDHEADDVVASNNDSDDVVASNNDSE